MYLLVATVVSFNRNCKKRENFTLNPRFTCNEMFPVKIRKSSQMKKMKDKKRSTKYVTPSAKIFNQTLKSRERVRMRKSRRKKRSYSKQTEGRLNFYGKLSNVSFGSLGSVPLVHLIRIECFNFCSYWVTIVPKPVRTFPEEHLVL